MANNTCPVCDQEYFSCRRWTVNWRKLSRIGSNTLFTECFTAERGPDDGEAFEVLVYRHTYDQAKEYQENNDE